MYSIKVIDNGGQVIYDFIKDTLKEANELGVSRSIYGRVIVRGPKDQVIWDSKYGIPNVKENKK